MNIRLQPHIIIILAFILCVTQTAQGWCMPPSGSQARNTIATHLNSQQVTDDYRPGKTPAFSLKSIKANIVAPIKKLSLKQKDTIWPRIKIFFRYSLEVRALYKHFHVVLYAKRQRLSLLNRLMFDGLIITWLIKPLLVILAVGIAKGVVSLPQYSLDTTNVRAWYEEQLFLKQDGIPNNSLFFRDLGLHTPTFGEDYMSFPDSLRCHFYNYDKGKDSVQFVIDYDISFLPSRIEISNPYDYDVLDSIARGDIPTIQYLRSIAEESIHWYDLHGGRQALARAEMDAVLASVPKKAVEYKVKIGDKYNTRQYMKPDIDYLRTLANSLSPLPNITEPPMSESTSVQKIQAIIRNALKNNTRINEKDLNGPMAHYMRNFLKRAAPDLEVFVLPAEYLTGMYPKAHPDFFTIEWLNAQRHPRVDRTTALIEVHFEADVLGFGNYAYPKLLPKVISHNGEGMAQYSHFLEYPNTELLEAMSQGDLITGSPELLKIYMARKIDAIIRELRTRQPHIKKIALIGGHASGSYASPVTNYPSNGWSAKYKPEHVMFHRDSVVTWDDRIARNNKKGYNYGYNKIKRSWLLNKTKKGIIRGINSSELSQLRDLGVLTWTEDSYPYVSFTEEMLLDVTGKDALFDKMRAMSWDENSPQWKRLVMALDKHGASTILTLNNIVKHDLYPAVKLTGWPVETLDRSSTTDSTASLPQEIYTAA